jgi:hypothetical protein
VTVQLATASLLLAPQSGQVSGQVIVVAGTATLSLTGQAPTGVGGFIDVFISATPLRRVWAFALHPRPWAASRLSRSWSFRGAVQWVSSILRRQHAFAKLTKDDG